ncbi:NAD(P)-dependent oxidoreductase [Caballeronia calidae]|uniref:NAD(P)-dependent oxidoreductase n=1 Tax=Caballeronia calidae TaxID=1777139 RepID=UPI0022B75B01|nr:NAD(P)-dependent oxidoreductase [Caballeronia calidae]
MLRLSRRHGVNIGYVGLGNMGGALARRLLLRHSLHVYDLSATAVEALVDLGAKACSSLAELASVCDTIFLCLPTSNHVREMLFGEGGIASALRRGTMIVDQTTGDPMATAEMARQIAALGSELIDAPVSGGIQGAEAGTIAIMVGAHAPQFERISPILASISKNVFHAGAPQAGQVIKLVNNMLSAAQRLLSFEGMALAVKNGVDPQKACEILVAGGARNVFLEKFMASHILKGDLYSGFTLGLMHKDVRLACELGSDSGVPMLFGNLTRDFYQICINEFGKDAQVHSAALMVDRCSGSKLVPKNSDYESRVN